MKMNALEKLLVNNPVRTGMVRWLARGLLEGGPTALCGKCVLEIGCGQGAGTEVLLRACGAERVIAFDYDPAQLNRARQRHLRCNTAGVALFLGDGEHLPFPDSQFDVVIEFAILHHMPDWRRGLNEIARVLKPGGVFLFEEFLGPLLARAVTRLFVVHPESGMFTAETFYEALDRAGLSRGSRQRRVGQFWLAGTAQRL